jgi:hypothetical protein
MGSLGSESEEFLSFLIIPNSDAHLVLLLPPRAAASPRLSAKEQRIYRAVFQSIENAY